MDVVCLEARDRELLCNRVAEFGNSHQRMALEMQERGNAQALERLKLLRGIERRFMIDLGSLCDRFRRRDDAHPLERLVLSYVAMRKTDDSGDEQLLVLVDRVRQVRDLMQEGEPACDWQP